MSKHTPGPWRVGDAGHTVFGPKETDGKLPQRIGELCAVRESYLANAKLIAAAPDMAALLNEWRCFVLHGSSRRYTEKEMLAWTNELLAKAGL